MRIITSNMPCQKWVSDLAQRHLERVMKHAEQQAEQQQADQLAARRPPATMFTGIMPSRMSPRLRPACACTLAFTLRGIGVQREQLARRLAIDDARAAPTLTTISAINTAISVVST